MVIDNSSLRSCPLEAGESGFQRTGSKLITTYESEYESRDRKRVALVQCQFLRNLDFAIPFRRGRVKIAKKKKRKKISFNYEAHLHTFDIA